MSSSVKLPSLIRSAVCHTKAGYTQAKHLWIINDFGHIHANRKVILCSLPFSADNIFRWQLKLDPYGFGHSKGEFMGLGLVSYKFYDNNLHKFEHHPLTGELKASITNAENQAIITESINFTKSHKDQDLKDATFYKFVERDYLFAARDELLPQDRLTISCEITYMKQSDIVSTSGESFSFSPLLNKNEPTGVEDFEKLFKDDEFADVTLLFNGEKYRAHKGILAARSPVFKSMLRADKIEKKSNRIKINDLDKSIFIEMLCYIYTGKPKNLKKNAIGLLEAADKYELKQLKIICENELIENLSKDNVEDILSLADEYNSANLKNAAVQFSKVNFNDIDVTNGSTEEVQEGLDFTLGEFFISGFAILSFLACFVFVSYNTYCYYCYYAEEMKYYKEQHKYYAELIKNYEEGSKNYEEGSKNYEEGSKFYENIIKNIRK